MKNGEKNGGMQWFVGEPFEEPNPDPNEINARQLFESIASLPHAPLDGLELQELRLERKKALMRCSVPTPFGLDTGDVEKLKKAISDRRQGVRRSLREFPELRVGRFRVSHSNHNSSYSFNILVDRSNLDLLRENISKRANELVKKLEGKKEGPRPLDGDGLDEIFI